MWQLGSKGRQPRRVAGAVEWRSCTPTARPRTSSSSRIKEERGAEDVQGVVAAPLGWSCLVDSWELPRPQPDLPAPPPAREGRAHPSGPAAWGAVRVSKRLFQPLGYGPSFPCRSPPACPPAEASATALPSPPTPAPVSFPSGHLSPLERVAPDGLFTRHPSPQWTVSLEKGRAGSRCRR